MAYSESYCDSYFQKFANMSQPIYIWGENITLIIDPTAEANRLFKLYGSSTGQYNEIYYSQKCRQAYDNHTYASDCSGFFAEISNNDMTANGYYSSCLTKGTIDTIDLSHSCLVFRGSSSKITHMGYYCRDGYTYEMSNSNDNFKKRLFNSKNWTYWGKPAFIDYSIVDTPVISEAKQYLYKGIDISSYQKNLNYQALKDAGVDFAVLKIINKQGEMDSMYAQHSLNLDAVGIKIQAVYNYSYATNIDQAIYMANKVLEYLGNRKCAVCLDVEDNVQKTLGAGLIDIINAYQSVVESSGRSFILYSGQAFYNRYIAPYSGYLKCKQLWLARYYKGYESMDFSDDPDQVYKPMDGILAWQYTSSGQIKGIDGRIDLNVMYKEIDGTSYTPISLPVNLNSVIKNTVVTNGKKLNVRNKPSIDGTIVGKMNNGANVIIYGVDPTGKWARLSVPDSLWSSLDYISSTGRGIVTAEKSLYVRSSDSKSGDIWGVYKSGEVIKILHQSTNTGWYLTVGKSKDGTLIGGWCSNKYVRTK